MFPLIASELAAFEQRLSREITSSVDFIQAIAEELIHAGGKRLRPALAFLAGRLLAADTETAMRVALSVEMLHSASLLHDDLIDDAATRRGHEAAFRRYGNVVSVMSGDYLLARVLGVLADSGSREFTSLMSRAAARVCEGEVLQFQMATLENHSFEGYRTIIEGKTAVLMATALEGVAMLHGSDAATRTALRETGMAYGRAFQMRDDYLDLLGDENELGKPLGGDLREGKATLPVLLLLEQGVDEIGELLRRHAGEPDDVARAVELIRSHGADHLARERIRSEVDRALAALDHFEPSPARDALGSLVRRESERMN